METKHINLPDDDVEAFELFVTWIYGAPMKQFDGAEISTHMKLIFLGEKLCLEPLINEGMNQFRIFYQAPRLPVTTSVIRYVYENAAPKSPLRQFLLRLVVRKAKATGSLKKQTLRSPPKRCFGRAATLRLSSPLRFFPSTHFRWLKGTHATLKAVPSTATRLRLRARGFEQVDEAHE